MPSQTENTPQCWPAPAKLNLFLHVTGRRPDGYHNLQTLFQILDWGDELSFTINDSGRVSRTCNISTIPESEDICIRAAKLLSTRAGVQKGAHINLLKRIPVGAGLGGGSSDAATVLLALNQLWCCELSTPELAELGLELGADVPVFVNGYSAWAQGRGEKLQPVALGRRYYVLVFPGIRISTADVFRHPMLKRDSSPIDMELSELHSGRNDCEPVAVEIYPQLKHVIRDLHQWGQPHMSGTGSTFFLPFDHKKTAINAAGELKSRYTVRAVSGVDRSQLLDGCQRRGE